MGACGLSRWCWDFVDLGFGLEIEGYSGAVLANTQDWLSQISLHDFPSITESLQLSGDAGCFNMCLRNLVVSTSSGQFAAT